MLWNKHEYRYSADIFVKNIVIPFHDTGLFLYFLKCISKTGFLIFSGGMVRDQCHVMGYESFSLQLLTLILIQVNEDSTYNWKKFLTKWNWQISHLILMANLSPLTLKKNFFILFNISSVFFFQFEACVMFLLSCVICFWFCFACIDLWTMSLFDWG